MNSKVKEEKKLAMKGWDDKTKQPLYKAFKSKVRGLEDAVFESRSVKHTAQFIETSERLQIMSR